MKQLFLLLLTAIAVGTSAQDKYNYIHFNKLTEVQGTEYVIASIENLGKLFDVHGRYFIFINTKTGESRQVDIPADAFMSNITQVRIDSLGINKLILAARTVDLNGKKGIDWEDPEQIIVLSTDGQSKTQLTDSKLFVRTWVVNRQTGTIIVTGHYDTNSNNKYDKTDKSEILIYDLRTLKLVSKI
jgi:hypothetical protein